MSEYKAILCDDDEIVIQGLQAVIPWEDTGIELCGYAYDGASAKKLIDQIRPDIVISDVRMPFATGIELTKYSKAANKDVQVIIISGYDSFQYAQQAIRAGAMDYLLKPVDVDELQKLLEEAVRKCGEREEEEEAKQEYEKAFIRQRVNSLINEGEDGYVRRYGGDVPEVLQNLYYGSMFAVMNEYESIVSRVPQELTEELRKVFFRSAAQFSENAVIFDRRPGRVSLFLFSGTQEAVQKMMEEYEEETRRVLQEICPGETMTFFEGNIYRGSGQVRRSYEEAKTLYDERFIYPHGSVNHYSKTKRNRREQKEVLSIDELIDVRTYVKYLLNRDLDSADRKLEEFREKLLQSGGTSHIYLQVVIANFYGTLREELKKLDFSDDDPVFITMDECQQLSLMENVDKTIELLHILSERVILRLKNRTDHKNAGMIMKAKEYIGAHFTEHTLTMEEAAKAVHVSPSHFSVQFKNETGQSFSEYLIQLRIERAKDLLRNTDMLAYEIAEAVGYDTAAYYSTAFKKATGYSPSEYKKKFK